MLLIVMASTPQSATTQQSALSSYCHEILVVDARDWGFGERLAGATLQGIVNKDAPRLVIIYTEGDLTVFRYFIEEALGCRFHLERLSLNSLISRYRDYVKGIVIYDPSLPDTVNLATVIASISNLVVAPPGLAL